MKSKLCLAAACAAALGLQAAPAHAGVYTGEMSKCLVASTSAAEQLDLVVWIFSAIGKHPAAAQYSAMTPAQDTAATKRAGELMQRLLTINCRKETLQALKYEGTGALEAAFSTLGEVAMREMMNDPKVVRGLEKLGDYMDKEKLAELGKEVAAVVP